MSPTAPQPAAPDSEYARALEVEPGALTSPPEDAPDDAEAHATQVLRAYLAASHSSPVPFPSIAMEILELVRYPDVDLNELSRYIRVDGALAGGVLALANSAIYRAVRRIDTIKDAVSRLGISEVARLAAAISMRSLYSVDAAQAREAFQPLWQRTFHHAVTVARCASELAKQKLAPTSGVEQTFMAGLLHDVGLAAALRGLAELVSYGKLPVLADPALSRVLHRVHLEVGVELHKGWQLPGTLSEAAAHHHGPVPQGEMGPAIHLVRMVSARDLMRRAPGVNPRGPAEVVESARALGVPPDRVRALDKDLEAAEAWVTTAFPA